MTMTINLTPHEIRIVHSDGSLIAAIPPSGKVARVTVNSRQEGWMESIPLYLASYGEVTNPPDGMGQFVVSRVVADALRGKVGYGTVMLVPHDLVRAENGAVVGCRGLEVVA